MYITPKRQYCLYKTNIRLSFFTLAAYSFLVSFYFFFILCCVVRVLILTVSICQCKLSTETQYYTHKTGRCIHNVVWYCSTGGRCGIYRASYNTPIHLYKFIKAKIHITWLQIIMHNTLEIGSRTITQQFESLNGCLSTYTSAHRTPYHSTQI